MGMKLETKEGAMCRLYGFLATHPTRLECSLIEAQNALQVQSDRDARGVRNADGWGIARYLGADREVIKSTMPAFADAAFAEVARTVWSEAAIAHVRAATVGRVSEANTHPFTHGAWSFAHNGTIHDFEHVRTRLDLGGFGPPTGETDSESVFLWLLNKMSDYGLDPLAPARHIDQLVELLGDAVFELIDHAIASGATSPPSLNFLLTDGHHLAASRWGNTLYWTFRNGVPDCSVCGTSHCPSADEHYRAVVIASEPLTDEDWMEVPDGSILAVEPGAHTLRRDLVPDAA